MLVEHLEEIAVARHQFPKRHATLLMQNRSAAPVVNVGAKPNRRPLHQPFSCEK
jgi:hypothetical protein